MRTGKSRKNRSNKDVAVVSSKSGMQGRLLRLLDRVLDGATGWAGPSAFSLEQLEPRVMLSDSTLAAAGQYSLYDSATAHTTTKADIVVLNTGSTASVGVNVTDGGSAGAADLIDLVINDPDAGAAENLTVNLVSSGPIHSITYNGSAGDTLTLNVTIADISEGADAAHLTGGVTFTTAVLEDTLKFQDTDTLTATTFEANGNIGATTLSGNLAGGGATYTNNGPGTIGALSITGGLDLTSGSDMTITGDPNVTITGNVTLGNHTLTVDLPDGGSASIASGATIAANGSGSLVVNGAGDVAGLAFGDFTTSETGATSGGLSVDITNDATGAINFNDVTLGDLGEADTGGVSVTVGGTADGFTFGDVTLNSTSGAADVVVNVGGDSGALQVGDVTASGVGTNQNGDFTFQADGNIGNIGFGTVTLGDHGDGDASAIDVESIAANGNIGSVTFTGDVALAALGNIDISGTGTGTTGNIDFQGDVTSSGTADIDIATDSTGAIGTVTLAGDTTISSSGNIEIGDDDAASMGNISIHNVTISGSGDLSFLAATQGSVSVGSTWVFSSSGSVFITAAGPTGSIGDIGGAAWDIDFASGVSATAGLQVSSSDGVGNLLIDSVDYFNPADGAIQINANADAGSEDGTVGFERVGSMGTVTISNPGNNSVNDTAPNSWNNIEWGTNSFIAALSIGNISIAGGAEGKFVASLLPQSGDAGAGVGTDGVINASVAHIGGSGTIGTVSLAGQSNGLVLVADDGIGLITINDAPVAAEIVVAAINAGNSPANAYTLVSTATDVEIDANNDIADEDGNGTPGANIVGSVAGINSVGASGVLALSGSVTGVSVGNIALNAGDLDLDVDAVGGTADADRLALNASSTSTIGNVTVSLGSITGGHFVADSGVGNILTQGSITLNAIDANGIENDGIAGATNNPIGTITAGGFIHIHHYHNISTSTTFDASQSVGAITAGNQITIPSLEVGGNLPSITVMRASTSGDGFIELGNNDLTVLGSVGTITSGLTPDDSIEIFGTIDGDLNAINAGAGTVEADLTVEAANAAVNSTASANPLFVITQGDGENADSATDYILSLAGTWNNVTNPATVNRSMNVTVSFDGDGSVDGTNGVTINDLTGDTSATDSILALATRANATDGALVAGVPTANVVDYLTNGLGTKTTASEFNLNGFTDTYSAVDPTGTTGKGRNNFKELLIEGDLDGGIGNPGLITSTVSANAVIASNAPILGTVVNIDIAGNWDNPATDDNSNPANRIFVASLSEISVGSVSNSASEGNGSEKAGSDPFTYEAVDAASTANPNYHGVAAGANRDGVWEDLEVFSTLQSLGSSNVSVSVLPSSHITKSFVGPSGSFEFIEFTDNDPTVVDTFVLNFNAGLITNIYIFGQQAGIEYNATDPANPATSSATNIFYGFNADGTPAAAGTPGAEPTEAGINAVDFLEFSSTIGNIDVRDADTTNLIPTNVGPVLVGFIVNENGLSDVDDSTANDYINNNGDGGEAGFGVPVANSGTDTAAIETAGLGTVTVDGNLGLLVTSGDVGNVLLTDTVSEATPVPSVTLEGLVADGSAGSVTVNGGGVASSLVAGNAVVTALGADNAIGGAGADADSIGISTDGALGFTGDITITGGNLGTTHGTVEPIDTNPNLPEIQQPGIIGDQVSVPNGFTHNILVQPETGLTTGTEDQGKLNAAVVSGKHVLVDNATQANDSITGNITAVDVFGYVWSGESISGNITATGVAPFLAPGGTFNAGDINARGTISYNAGANPTIFATGGTPGDITGNILAAGDMNNVIIQAGAGDTGGSILSTEIVAGTDGIGSFTGTNKLVADNNIGTPTSIVSAANDMDFNLIQSGRQSLASYAIGDIPFGDIDADFVTGTAPPATLGALPITTHFANTTLPILSNSDDSIDIGTLQAGLNGTSGDYNLNGTLAAAGSIFIDTLNVDGNAVGNDGVAGGHIAAAGLGDKDADGVGVDDQNELFIGGGTITGTLSGTFSAGLFVPTDTASASPLNPNDVGPLLGGTVLTTGAVDISLTTGIWDQSATGASGTGGVTLPNLIAGTDTGVVSGFVPAFSVGATCNIELDIDVVGLAFSSPSQTGIGNITPNPATGTATDVSIAAFGSVDGSVTVSGTADFNLVLSNIDAVTAFDGSLDGSTIGGGGHVVNPSAPSTLVPLQSGSIVGNPTPGNVASSLGIDNNLSITSNGNASGGLNVDYYLAGLDYFVQEAGADHTSSTFWSSFGFGSIGTTHRAPTLAAHDASPTNGFQAGDLTFDLIAAGQNVKVSLTADNDIESGLGNAGIEDGLIPTVGTDSFDADIVAGADARSVISPLGQVGSFSGGNISGSISAGDDILSLANPNSEMTIAAIGNQADGTGNVSSNITSGTLPQFGTPVDEVSNINAFIIAGDSVTGTIDAGDTAAFGGDNAGAFTGGIWAGTGVDLNINTTADNSFDQSGSISGTIRTGGSLDAIQGIYAQFDINVIEVGFGDATYQLLGNVAAEHDINEIQVWGDLGATDNVSTVAAGDHIVSLGVGNASGIGANPGDFARLTHPADEYINTFGTIFDNVVTTNGITHLFYVTLAGTISSGSGAPTTDFTFNQNGQTTTYHFSGGEGIFIVGPNGVDIYAFDSDGSPTDGNGGLPISLTVTGPAGIDRFVAVDGLDELDVLNGSVNQIIVSDTPGFDVVGTITAALGAIVNPLSAFPFITDSLVISNPANTIGPEIGNDKVGIDANIINVSGNIGTTTALNGQSGASIGTSLTGLTAADNVAIFVEGNLLGGVTSEHGSIGNVVVIGQDTVNNDDDESDDDFVGIDRAGFVAQNNIGDIYSGLGSFGFGDGFIEARTGSMGILSVRDSINLDDNIDSDQLFDGSIIDVQENIGGLVARTGQIGNLVNFDQTISDTDTSNFDDDFDTGVHVHGSIGLIQASGEIGGIFVAETGSVGVDLRPSADNYVTPFVDSGSAGIRSDVGNIIIDVAAGTQIGNIEAKIGDIGGFDTIVGEGEDGERGDDVPTILAANGGVTIDPTTLGFTTPAVANGIGDIFADLGNIDVEVTTATDLGVFQGDNTTLVGGIAAPLGTVDVSGAIGGDLGGISGSHVNSDGLSVAGTTGITHEGDTGSTTFTRSIAANSTTTITNGGVTYLLEIGGGTGGTVQYTVNTDGSVEFNKIVYNSDGSATSFVSVLTNNNAEAQVDELDVNGSVNSITVDGDLDELNVNGNLGISNGVLLVTGDLNDADVSGNIGTGPGTIPGTAANLTVHVGGFFDGFDVGGTDFGLGTIVLDSVAKNTLGPGGAAAPQFISIPNGNGSVATGDAFLNVYIGTGSAVLTVDNGVITEVLFNGTSASNFEVVASAQAMTVDALKAQFALVAKNQTQTTVKGVKVNNEFLAGQASAHIGLISANSTKFKLTGLMVEGDVDTVAILGSASNVAISGSVTTQLLATLGLKNVVIANRNFENSGIIDGGVSVTNLVVSGNIDVIKATKTISNVVTETNAGIVSSGGTMSKVNIGGDSIVVTAETMSNVIVDGSVGVSIGAEGGSVGLGAANTDGGQSSNTGIGFTLDDIARILKVDSDQLSTMGNPGSTFTIVPGDGDSGTETIYPQNVFYGGLEARTAKNVSVGAAGISDLLITGSGSRTLLDQTLDDGFVKIGKTVYSKVNGGQVTATTAAINLVIGNGTVVPITL